MALILIVEDEQLLRWSLAQRLKAAGHEVHAAATLAEARTHLDGHRPEVMLLDLSLPDGFGLDFFEAAGDRLEDSVVLVMTAVGQIEDAVRAMKLGAMDFLTKPVNHGELVALIDRSLARRSDHLEAQAARQAREKSLSINVVAHSPAFKETLDVARRVAESEVSSVLIQGESGTGKNVVAKYIHSTSARRQRPYIELNCAAIPDQLLESELFGHERGAFTDAKATRQGIFELADSGSAVLDEIGEFKLSLQSKMLHFLEGRSFRRVGGVRAIHVDVRVIALTNRNLHAMVGERLFRDDLYYRLNVFPITVPPLRDRPEDILPLAEHVLHTLQLELGHRLDGFDRDAENMLLGYPWPGNVRELRNVVERALILERGSRITTASLVLDAPTDTAAAARSGMPDGIVPLEDVEWEMVRRAMAVAGGNQTRAAELLRVSRDQLRYRLKRYAKDGRPIG